jgi:hypothetical protein
MKKRFTIILTVLLLSALACNLPAGIEQAPAAQTESPPQTALETPASQPVQAETLPAAPPAVVEAPSPTPTEPPIDPQPVGIRQGLASLDTYKLVMVTKTSGPTALDHSETRMEMTGDNPNDALVVYNRSSSMSEEDPEPDVSETYQYAVGLESCDGFGEDWSYEALTPAEKELRDAMTGLFDMLVLGPGAQFVGVENVNGIESRHFSFRVEGLGVESGSVVNANQGDYWVAVDGQYLVRYQLLLEFSNSAEETFRLETNMDLSQVNQPVNIVLPAGCQPESSAP